MASPTTVSNPQRRGRRVPPRHDGLAVVTKPFSSHTVTGSFGLTVRVGQVVRVVDSLEDPEWWMVQFREKFGRIPSSHVRWATSKEASLHTGGATSRSPRRGRAMGASRLHKPSAPPRPSSVPPSIARGASHQRGPPSITATPTASRRPKARRPPPPTPPQRTAVAGDQRQAPKSSDPGPSRNLQFPYKQLEFPENGEAEEGTNHIPRTGSSPLTTAAAKQQDSTGNSLLTSPQSSPGAYSNPGASSGSSPAAATSSRDLDFAELMLRLRGDPPYAGQGIKLRTHRRWLKASHKDVFSGAPRARAKAHAHVPHFESFLTLSTLIFRQELTLWTGFWRTSTPRIVSLPW